MPHSANPMREDAIAIWQAGVDAVRADRLVREFVRLETGMLLIGDDAIDLADVGRIAVVGTGKAGAGMASAVEEVLDESLLPKTIVTGIVSVPENCVLPLGRIELRAGRPAGVNEPTAAGVRAAEEILSLVGQLDANDVCLCLISGGGSALLPAPIEGVSLEEKQFITRELSARGADICDLNTVRKQLSRIKGEGLARSCTAGRLETLIISDVLGDPLDLIASGPTVEDRSTPHDAMEVLQRFDLLQDPQITSAARTLRSNAASEIRHGPLPAQRGYHVMGNNATAVDAAGQEAVRRGYQPALVSASKPEPAAEEVAAHLATMAQRMLDQEGPDCLISGGEPTVTLVEEASRGLGGRNQQLALAALPALGNCRGLVLLSGGTDGEDGPTDAAGALIDELVVTAAAERISTRSDFSQEMMPTISSIRPED